MHSTFRPASRLQSPTGLHLVQIAVEVELEHCRRAVPGATGRGRTGKAKCLQIELANEHVDDANRVVLGDIVIQAIAKQQPFPPVLPLDKATHTESPDHPGETTISGVFTQPPPSRAICVGLRKGPGMGHDEPSTGDTCLAGKVGPPPSDGYQASGLDR